MIYCRSLAIMPVPCLESFVKLREYQRSWMEAAPLRRSSDGPTRPYTVDVCCSFSTYIFRVGWGINEQADDEVKIWLLLFRRPNLRFFGRFLFCYVFISTGCGGIRRGTSLL